MKKLISFIVSIFISYFAGTLLFFSFHGILRLLENLHLVSLEKFYTRSGIMSFFGFIILIFFLISLIVVIKSRKTKNYFYQLFKFTKPKLLLNFVILIAILVIGIFFSNGKFITLKAQDFSVYYYLSNPLYSLFGLTVFYIYLYPFSAVIISLITLISLNEKKLKSNLFLLIVMVELLNPYVINLGIANYFLLRYDTNIKENKLIKCGVRITKINKGDAAEKAGLRAFEIINKINNNIVYKPDDLLDMLHRMKEPKPIKLETESKTYYVFPKKDIATGKLILGIAIVQGYCNK